MAAMRAPSVVTRSGPVCQIVSDFDLHGIRVVHEIEVHAHVVVDARSCVYGIEEFVFYLIDGSRGRRCPLARSGSAF